MRAKNSLERLAKLSTPVLIRGETGTGKELAARLLHDAGPRAKGPFVAVNCGAIPEGLAESILFGHVRGAFTGAHRAHTGAFARAEKGTLVLDEVAELPSSVQAKLLRTLETRRVIPVGSEREAEVDVRIVSATHRDLDLMIRRGQLREDLYHRLGVLLIELPPLRERQQDIPGLLHHFARLAGSELGHPVQVDPDAVAAARQHAWPGNIRALRNAVYRSAALTGGRVTRAELLPRSHQVAPRPSILTDTSADPSQACDERGPQPPGPSESVSIPRGSYQTMRRAMLAAIVAEQGSIRRAARVLQLPRSTLGTWLKQ